MRLALVGGMAFVTGVTEAAVLGLITTAAVATTSGGLETSASALGPIHIRPVPALVVAVILLATNLVFGIGQAWLASSIGADAGRAARKELLQSFHRASYSRKTAHRTAALQERLTTHVDKFLAGFSSVTTLISSALSLASFALMAVLIDPLAVGALGTVGVLIVAVQRPMTQRTRRSARALAEGRASYVEGATESVLLAREMDVFGVAAAAGERLQTLDRDVARSYRETRLYALSTPRVYQVLAFAMVIVALATIRGTGASDLTSIAAVALILLRSLTYGQALLSNLQSLSEYRPYVDELTSLIDEYAASSSVFGETPIGALTTLQFKGVGFAYGATQVLSDINLNITVGETLGIVGPSGAGKSTLINLMLRLYEPTTGSIEINGVPLVEVEDATWHRCAAIVPQEPRLLAGTVADNIQFLRSLDPSALRRAADEAHVGAFVRTLPSGFDTPVGELGQGVSGGQRQRICIARALAGSPELLVLDEPTSALDGESEAAIQATLSELSGRVTMLLVAHRLSTLSICDRIAVMDGGKIAALGTPDELRRTSPYFREAMAHARL
jgi:ATP-binding cassette subfamily B protein